jgi:hypothetical protein
VVAGIVFVAMLAPAVVLGLSLLQVRELRVSRSYLPAIRLLLPDGRYITTVEERRQGRW